MSSTSPVNAEPDIVVTTVVAVGGLVVIVLCMVFVVRITIFKSERTARAWWEQE
jgi:hypothetical protein